MKKTLFFFVACFAMMASTLVSCSDSDDLDDNSYVKVSDAISANGITVERLATVASLPVTAKGHWVAVVLEDAADWVRILDEDAIYTGSQELSLVFDQNDTGAGRKGTLALLDSEGNELDVPLRQLATINGVEPSNDENSTVVDFMEQGVGYAIDYQYFLNLSSLAAKGSFNPLKCTKQNPLFNNAMLERQNKVGKDDGHTLFVEQPIAQTSAEGKNLASLVQSDKHLKASLCIEIGFGCINASVEGEYNSNAEDTSSTLNYTVTRDLPIHEFYLQPINIRNLIVNNSYAAWKDSIELAGEDAVEELEDWYEKMKEKYADNKEKLLRMIKLKVQKVAGPTYGNILSDGFKDLYMTFEVAWEEGDSATCRAALESMDNFFGPFIAVGGQYGGVLNIVLAAKAASLTGTTELDGKVKADICDVFSANAEVEYKSTGADFLRNSEYDIKVVGGTYDKVTKGCVAFLDNFKTKTIENDAIKDLQAVIAEWEQSIQDKKNVSIASYTFTPIWSFFTDNQAVFIKNWFQSRYKADQFYDQWVKLMGSESGTIDEETVNNLLNWKDKSTTTTESTKTTTKHYVTQ